jgi:hypothetical protein
MGRVENNPSIGWVHPKSTHDCPLNWVIQNLKKKFGVWFPCKCASIAISFENNGIWMLILSVNPPHTRKHKAPFDIFWNPKLMHFGCFLFEELKTTISKAKKKNKKSSTRERTEIISSKWTQKEIVHQKFDHYYYYQEFFFSILWYQKFWRIFPTK